MVNLKRPTSLGIKEKGLNFRHPATRIKDSYQLTDFLSCFADLEFTLAKRAKRREVFEWRQDPRKAPIGGYDDEHQFKRPVQADRFGFRSEQGPTAEALKVYAKMLMEMFPSQKVTLLTPKESAKLSAQPHVWDARLYETTNILFILSDSEGHYRFAEFNRQESILWVADPCAPPSASAPQKGLSGLQKSLSSYASGDIVTRYHYMEAKVPPEASWVYAMRAAQLWFQAVDRGGIRDADDSCYWNVSMFIDDLEKDIGAFYVKDVIERPPVELPNSVCHVLESLVQHKEALEYAKWEMDNGAEAVLFKGVSEPGSDRCSSIGHAPDCMVEILPLRRDQKTIFNGFVNPRKSYRAFTVGKADKKDYDYGLAQLQSKNASQEEIHSFKVTWDPTINRVMAALDARGHGFFKPSSSAVDGEVRSILANTTNIVGTQSFGPLGNFAFLEIDGMQPIIWVGRPDKGTYTSNLKNGPSYDGHKFHGPTPWKKPEPLCTEAVVPEVSLDLADGFSVLLNDSQFTQDKIQGRIEKFGEWLADENTSVSPFDDEDRFQRAEAIEDPRGLDPESWVSSDLLDDVVKDCQRKHGQVSVFPVSIAAVLATSREAADLQLDDLRSRFWVFPQSDAHHDEEATHWWVTIVDRVKGHFYSHNSHWGFGNAGMLFQALAETLLSTAVQGIEGTAPRLIQPDIWEVETRQQVNNFDCGVFTAKTLTGFLEAITLLGPDIPVAGTSPAGFPCVPPEGMWSPSEHREFLKTQYPVALKHVVGPVPGVMLGSMGAILKERAHAEQLERAMWHLDHAGGVLLHIKNLNVNGTSHCVCSGQMDSCGLGVVAVPAGYKVLIMSDTQLGSGGGYVPNPDIVIPPDKQEIYKQVVLESNRELSLGPEESENLFLRNRNLFSNIPQVLVGNAGEAGGFARCTYIPEDSRYLVEIMGISGNAYNGDTVKLPDTAYMRLNEQLWVWIARPVSTYAASRLAEYERIAAPGMPLQESIPLKKRAADFAAAWKAKAIGFENSHGGDKYDPSDDSLEEQDNLGKKCGVRPRKRKLYYQFSSSDEDAHGVFDRSGRARARKRQRLAASASIWDSLPPVEPATYPRKSIRKMMRPAADSGSLTFEEIKARITKTPVVPHEPSFEIIVTTVLGDIFPLPSHVNGDYESIRGYLEKDGELFPKSTMQYGLASGGAFDFNTQEDYFELHRKLMALKPRRRVATIQIHLKVIFIHGLQFTIRGITVDSLRQMYITPPLHGGEWNMSSKDFIDKFSPHGERVTWCKNEGGPVFAPSEPNPINSESDLRDMYYAVAASEYPMLQIISTRDFEEHPTPEMAGSRNATIEVTRNDLTGKAALAPKTIRTAHFGILSWGVLPRIAEGLVGTSKDMKVTVDNTRPILSEGEFDAMMKNWREGPGRAIGLRITCADIEPRGVVEIASSESGDVGSSLSTLLDPGIGGAVQIASSESGDVGSSLSTLLDPGIGVAVQIASSEPGDVGSSLSTLLDPGIGVAVQIASSEPGDVGSSLSTLLDPGIKAAVKIAVGEADSRWEVRMQAVVKAAVAAAEAEGVVQTETAVKAAVAAANAVADARVEAAVAAANAAADARVKAAISEVTAALAGRPGRHERPVPPPTSSRVPVLRHPQPTIPTLILPPSVATRPAVADKPIAPPGVLSTTPVTIAPDGPRQLRASTRSIKHLTRTEEEIPAKAQVTHATKTKVTPASKAQATPATKTKAAKSKATPATKTKAAKSKATPATKTKAAKAKATPASAPAAPTPRVSEEGVPMHVIEKRYICPVCAKSVQRLGVAKAQAHAEKCGVTFNDFVEAKSP